MHFLYCANTEQLDITYKIISDTNTNYNEIVTILANTKTIANNIEVDGVSIPALLIDSPVFGVVVFISEINSKIVHV